MDSVTTGNKKTIQLSDELLTFIGFALEARCLDAAIPERESREENAYDAEYWRQEHLKALAFLVEFRIAAQAAA